MVERTDHQNASKFALACLPAFQAMTLDTQAIGLGHLDIDRKSVV